MSLPRAAVLRLLAATLSLTPAACHALDDGATCAAATDVADGGTTVMDATAAGAEAGLLDFRLGARRTCPSPVASDPYACVRRSCGFAAGARASDTVGRYDQARVASSIQHVIVVMKENRSFDHLFGALHAEGRPGVEPIPATFSNPDPSGAAVKPFLQTTSCIKDDPGHQWNDMHAQVDKGRMDGFVTSAATSTKTDGRFALSYYDRDDLPFYYWLASTYAMNDRHFASVRSGTFPNRDFLLLGTSDGIMSTWDGFPDAALPTLFDALDLAGVTWGVYTDDVPLGSLNWDSTHPHTGAFADFVRQVDDGSLPAVVFVDAVANVTDDHPPGDLHAGEAWLREIYEHVVAGPLWMGTALIWTYDESGGFFDHVVPPTDACVPRPGVAREAKFTELGPRVPMVVVSPYARPGYTSHVVQDHTAITRFVEAVFDLPALTARDANSDALLDLFDFECPAELRSPPPAPPAGTHGCSGNGRLD